MAEVVPEVVVTAIAALSAIPPPWTDTAKTSMSTLESAITVMCSTGVVPPTATLPTLAVVSPLMFVTEIPAPAATTPPATPTVTIVTLRIVVALTSIPAPAARTCAPLSIVATWFAVEFTTTTWAPTATTPPPPVKATPTMFSVYFDETVTAPAVAVSFVPVPTMALTLLSIVRTRTEAPMATTPPWIPPANPTNFRSSSATTLMLSPATIVAFEPIEAVVPPDGAAAIESATAFSSGAALLISVSA